MLVDERNLSRINSKHLQGNFTSYTLELLLFLGAANFLNLFYYWIFIAFVFFLMFWRSDKVRINLDFLLLFLMSCGIAAFSKTYQLQLTTIAGQFIYPICYLIGRNLSQTQSNTHDEFEYTVRQKRLIRYFVIISAGMFAHLMVNMVFNFGSSVFRNTLDFWSGEVMSATGQAALACYPLGIIPVVFLIKTKPIHKAFALFAFCVIMVYNLMLAGRTILVMAGVVFFLTFLYAMVQTGKISLLFKMLFLVSGLVALLIVAYQSNVFGFRDYIQETNLYERMFLMSNEVAYGDTSRLDLKIMHLQNMGNNLLGGANSRIRFGYAHDLLLDMYDEAGIVPFVFALIFMTSAVYKWVRCLASKRLQDSTKMFIVSLYTALFLEFCLEPIIIGVPWTFAYFCFACGIVHDIYTKLTTKFE